VQPLADAPLPPLAHPNARRLARRAAVSRPAARQLAVLAGLVAAGLAATWPRATYLMTGQVPDRSDEGTYIWDFWWVAHQVTHLGNPWFTRDMAAPVGAPLGFHVLMPLAGLLMTPVTLAVGAVFAFNLMCVIMPGLLSYAMYRAARLWVPSQPAAITAGALFGLSANLAWRSMYHLNIAAGVVFIPVALEAAVRLRREPSRRQAPEVSGRIETAVGNVQDIALVLKLPELGQSRRADRAVAFDGADEENVGGLLRRLREAVVAHPKRRPQAYGPELIDASLIAPPAAPVPPGILRIPAIAEGEPMVARQLAFEIGSAAVEEVVVVGADHAGVVEVHDHDRRLMEPVDPTLRKHRKQSERRAPIPVAQRGQQGARMPGRVKRGMNDEEIEFASPELHQRAHESARAESARRKTLPLDSGPIEFGLIGRSPREQDVGPDLQNSQRTLLKSGFPSVR